MGQAKLPTDGRYNKYVFERRSMRDRTPDQRGHSGQWKSGPFTFLRGNHDS